MKRFLVRLLLLLAIVAMLLTAVLLLVPNNKISDNSLFASYDKHQRLSSLKSPKIVLVGGSNLPFSVKSKMIEDSLGMPVVDMGLHAGLGMNYILSEVEKDIHKGDVVVVSLEYQHFLNKTMFNGEDLLAALLFDVNRDCMKYVKLGQWMALLPKISLYASKKIIDLTPKTEDDFEDSFTRESFNEYGDEVAHYGLPSVVHSGRKPALDNTVQGRAIRRLSKFRDFLRKQGAEFILVACPYPQKQYAQDEKAIGLVVDKVSAAGMPFEIEPKDCLFPDSLMFNTRYHLSEKATEMRTAQLINVLQKKCQSFQN